MAIIFIMIGSIVGMFTAVLSVLFVGAPLLAGLAIWAASGPTAVLLYLVLRMPVRALLHPNPVVFAETA